ncbi:MAG TPA: hydantoinase/oxoprolinase family protein [Solirubrobacteraceae bacterium]|nr:hydantoinase/oxoprolinase family protein [Solirubrobacteraceae bacterium]
MLGVDAGGTFTDVVAVRDGRIHVTKVATDPASPASPVVEGARRLGVEGSPVFNHASTMGLNAVLTRSLPKIGFLTTEGHRDMLAMGRIWRPLDAQTDPRWRRTFSDADRPLVPRYLRRGVTERVRADGSVLVELDEAQAREQLELLARCEVRGVAICLLNAYVDSAHEERLRELAHEALGDVAISISSEVSPLAKEFTRASTTVIDVLMKLLYGGYGEQLHRELTELGFEGELNFADCTATLLPWQEALRRPFRIVFAGPAAGTVSCRRFGAAIGDGDLICVDVGGTSTDVSLVVGGDPFVNDTFSLEHDLVINALATEVASVGAGGGSIVSISPSGDVHVGPQSAGAVPGPACYGRGGEQPTVSDACLLMGILDADGFAGGQMRLDEGLARAAFERLDTNLRFEQRVEFAYRLAVANVAEEITNIAIRHGLDPRDFSVVAYGAAGPMLIPATLELLRARRVIVPPHPGLFSALGLLSTDLVYSESRSAYLVLAPDAAGEIEAMFAGMEAALRERVDVPDGARVRRSFDGRLLGQSWETPFVTVPDGPIAADAVAEMIARFHDEYERRFGNRFDAVPVQAATYRVELTVPAEKIAYEPLGGDGGPTPPTPPTPTRIGELRHFGPEPLPIAEYDRAALAIGSVVPGPAIVREELSTTFVCPGQTATVGRFGEIVIEPSDEGARA